MPAGVLTEGSGGAGIFGKLPWLGDFVTRRLPRSFVEPWDSWLQAGMAATRETLGDAWLDSFLTAPVWRFLLPAGSAGPAAAGVLMPSVDRVGRYFPLTLAVPLDADPPPDAPLTTGPWFDALEDAALAALEESVAAEDWEASIERIAPFPAMNPPPIAEIGASWRAQPVSGAGGLGAAVLRLTADPAAPPLARFWTNPAADGWCLTGSGLPPPAVWPHAFMAPAAQAEAP
ncbi:type VI secretion system-associated protein TagF [Inquilinus limosus]|uniref:type VI secretion system-associated protein TagF n=1 Tax=Inquilinus limosus TaxID=171674 RepID=UPI003F17CA86